MRSLSAVVATVVMLAGARGVVAHEGHVHKVMGTVAVLDAARIEIETKEGKKESFALTKDTKYLKGKQAAAAADVHVGARVVLSVVEKEGKQNVTEVLLGEEPTAASCGPRRMPSISRSSLPIRVGWS